MIARLAAAVLLVLLLGGCIVAVRVPTGSRHERAEVRAAIDRAWTEHIEAAVAKDVDAVVQIYDDSIVYLAPGIDVRGRAAIDRMEAETLAAADVLTAEHTLQSLAVYGDVAYEIGTVVGPVRMPGEAAQVLTFHFVAQWVRGADGRWRIARFVGQPE